MKKYWLGVIGPVEEADVPDGGDLPLRMGVQNALANLIPNLTVDDLMLSSGWGITEEKWEAIKAVLYSA